MEEELESCHQRYEALSYECMRPEATRGGGVGELPPKINDGCTTITTPTEHSTCASGASDRGLFRGLVSGLIARGLANGMTCMHDRHDLRPHTLAKGLIH